MSDKSFIKEVIKPQTQYALGHAFAVDSPGSKVVVDPYSGKMYGDQKPDFYINHFKSQVEAIQQTLEGLGKGIRPQEPNTSNNPLMSNNNFSFSNLMINQPLTPKEQAELTKTYTEQLAENQKQLETFKTNYQFEDRFFESYDLYQDKWNAKFKGEYRNPRLAEDSETSKQVGKQNFDNQLAIRQSLNGNNAEAKKNLNPKTTGTGISKGAGGVSPFGLTEAGLNI